MGKYDSWQRGETEALLNRLSGMEVARKINTGELTVEVSGSKVEIKPTPQKLVDKNSRSIPFKGMGSKFVDANREFRFQCPPLDEKNVLLPNG